MRESNAKQKDRSLQQDAVRHGRRSTILAVVVVMHLPTFFAAAHGQTNSAPVVQMSIEDSTLTVGYPAARYDLSNHFSDPDGDDLSYVVTHGNAVGVLFSGSTMSLTGKAAGTTTVTVQAADPSGLYAELSFEATVRANTAPVVLRPIPDATLTVGGRTGTVVLSSHFQDVEEGDLTYAATSADPATATTTVAEGVLSVTAVAAGATTVAVTASDPAAATSAPDVFAVTVGSSVSVTIPDANLRTAVEAELGKDAGATINSAEMEGLGRLECDSCGIRNLTGLEFATGLTALALGGNSITDPTPLSGLTGLTDLDLGSNSLTDASPLSGLTGLTELDLGGNSLTDVSPLSGLTGLTELVLGDNSLTDVSPLSSLTALTELDLGGNSLTDVTPLSGLTSLTGLDLGSNSLTDVTPLSGLTGVTELDLGSNSLTDVSPLSGLTGLTGLDLGANSLTDASPLSGLTGLSDLDLGSNSLTDVSPLSGLIALTDVDLDGNSLTDISPLSSLTGLSRLYLRHNCLTGIHALTSNTGLGQGDQISLEWNPLLASAVAGDLAALRARGVNVLVSETASVEVGAPSNVSATPDDGELTLTWDSPRDPDDVTVYEVRWRSAAGTFNAWTIVPCSSKRRHKLTGLNNGTAYTVELRAAGHADNGVASTGSTTVNPPNRVPIVLLPIPNVTLTVGSGAAEVDLSNYFSDPDGDQLLFTASPPTIVTATVTGNTMTVSPVAAGTGVATVRAADPSGLFVEQTFNVTVAASAAPEVSLPISDMTLTVGGRSGTVILSAHFRDPEEGALTFSAVSASPAVATAAVADGVLTVSAVSAGTTRVTVTASDLGGATSAPEVFTVTAREPVNVQIPDANLRAALERELGKQAGETINSADMEQLEELWCDDCGIQNLTGLEFATAMTALGVGDNVTFSDLAPLSGLTKLAKLYVYGNAVADLAPLSGLTGLTELDLDHNEVTDVSSLSGLASLAHLSIGDNRLTNVSSLSSLNSLQGLNLGRNAITSISSLSGLTGLRRLVLRDNTITDISSLSNLTNVTYLDLSTNTITDVSALSSLTKLTDLSLQGNAIADISPLTRLTGLIRLRLEGNEIEDVTPLSGLTSLNQLYLARNCLTRIGPLTSNTGLGQGDYVSLEWNALKTSAVATDLTTLRDRGVNVVVSRTSFSAEVGSPINVSATPDDRELALIWDPPLAWAPARVLVEVPVYEARWRSATGTFNDWAVVPCSSKRRHKLTGLVNGTSYTVELRAAGHASNGVARVNATPSSGGVTMPVWTMLSAALTAPDAVPTVAEVNPYDGYEIIANGAWQMLVEDGTRYRPSVYLRRLEIVQAPPLEELVTQVEIRLSRSSTGFVPPPSSRFGRRMAFAVHDAGLNEALVDADGSPLVTARLDGVGDGWFVGTLEGDTDAFWDAIGDGGDYDLSEGLYVELRP